MIQSTLSLPRVAVDFMNRDHDEFANLRAALLDHIAGGTADAIDSLLDQLHQHTIRHFADEEKLMQETNFPVYTVHKEEHDSVLADMVARIAHWRRDGDLAALQKWLDMAVGEWLVAHIASMDTVTARFAAARQPP
ncbi:MAG: hemerythrin family protein [Rhodocyclales bacterium]|nr:hemerythrin family protein [Rhodocyclales bacterium]